jgi:ubiquitin
MKERDMMAGEVRTIKPYMTLADLKLKVAEHIIAQADCYQPDEVQSILAETKIGVWRRADLWEKLRIIFSMS